MVNLSPSTPGSLSACLNATPAPPEAWGTGVQSPSARCEPAPRRHGRGGDRNRRREGWLAAHDRLEAFDAQRDEPFQKILDLVRMVLGVPIASVSLMGRDHRWIRSHRGSDPHAAAWSAHPVEHAEPLIVGDTLCDERFACHPLVRGNLRMRSYMGVPITDGGGTVAVLRAMDIKPDGFGPDDIAMLSHFADLVRNELRLRLVANTDHLTGAFTRRGFEEQVGRELARSSRYERRSSILFFDVDHFKTINDSFGHAAGDEVLRQIGMLLSANLRPADIFGRLGGEEFGVLLPETHASNAFAVAERTRAAIQDHNLITPAGNIVKVTASFGVAPLTELQDVEAWFSSADKALYEAKASGRNCTRMQAH